MIAVCVNEPQLEAPVHGFLTAAVRDEEATNAWEAGFYFRPRRAPALTTWDPLSTGDARDKSVAAAQTTVSTHTPFVVEIADQSSTWGDPYDRLRRDLLQALDVSLSWAIERELWTGARGALPGLVNAGATDLNAAGPVSATTALALISEALGDSYAGALGMIHAPVAVASLWVSGAAESVSLNGTRLRTNVRGDTLCVGSGYPGRIGPGNVALAADAAARWVFATPIYHYRLSEPIVPGTEAEVIDTRRNEINLRAEQVVGLAPVTPLAGRTFAVRVTLP